MSSCSLLDTIDVGRDNMVLFAFNSGIVASDYSEEFFAKDSHSYGIRAPVLNFNQSNVNEYIVRNSESFLSNQKARWRLGRLESLIACQIACKLAPFREG
jgi:hypothetical protein